MTQNNKNPHESQSALNSTATKLLNQTIVAILTLLAVAIISAATRRVQETVKNTVKEMMPKTADAISKLVNKTTTSFEELYRKAMDLVFTNNNTKNALTLAIPVVEDAIMDKHFKSAKNYFTCYFRRLFGADKEPHLYDSDQEGNVLGVFNMITYRGKLLMAQSLAIAAAALPRTLVSLWIRMIIRTTNTVNGGPLFEKDFNLVHEIFATGTASVVYATSKKLPGNLAEFCLDHTEKMGKCITNGIMVSFNAANEMVSKGITYAWDSAKYAKDEAYKGINLCAESLYEKTAIFPSIQIYP